MGIVQQNAVNFGIWETIIIQKISPVVHAGHH